jgi:acetolactate synthase-1/2/3 large subunit
MYPPQTDSAIGPNAQPLTVAGLLLRYLAIEGVYDLFGVPGTPLSHLLYALKQAGDQFTYHICRHEGGAGYMADGYARVTGKLGVIVVSAGPSATNALTGAAVAQACGSSVLVISGEAMQNAFGRGGFQEGIDARLNINAIYRNAGHYSAVISAASNFQMLFTGALRAALSLPGSAAHISLPEDIGGAVFDHPVNIPASPKNYRAVPRGTNIASAERVLDYLSAARKPLFFLGNGCRRALIPVTGMSDQERAVVVERMARFQQLIEKFAVPVATSPNGKGIFPESHSLSLRNYGFGGGNWCTAYIAGQEPNLEIHYDALMVLASSLTEKTTNGWNAALVPKGPLVQVDLDQGTIGRGFPIELGVVAEVGGFIDDLISVGASIVPDAPIIRQRTELIRRIRSTPCAPEPVAPEQKLVSCINDQLPPGAQLFVDASMCAPAALRYMVIDPPTQMHNAFNMEPMGWAPAAVVGAAIGCPETICISISGDGGFMMNGNEVSTAARYKIGAVWVVFYNNTLADVEVHLKGEFPGSGWMDLYQLGSPNLVEVARGLGADAVEAQSIDVLRPAFAAALSNAKLKKKPQVIVFKA